MSERDKALEDAAIQCDKRAKIYREQGSRYLACEAEACAKVIRLLKDNGRAALKQAQEALA